MKQLDRHIVGELVRPFFGACALFAFLLLMFQILRLSDFLIVHRAPLGLVVQLAGFLVISISAYVIPIAFLAATLIAFGRISADSELVAMKACGFSMHRIIRPAFLLAAAASAVTLLMSFQLGPYGERTFNGILARTGDTQVAAVLKEGMFNSGFFDLLLFAEKIDGKNGTLSKVFVYDDREKNFPMVVVAKDGRIENLKSDSELGGQVLLRLFDGHTYQVDPKNLTSQVGGFDEYELFLKIDEAGAPRHNEPRVLTLGELRAQLKETDKASRRYRDLETEIWKRLSLSLAPLLFCFLGAGLGVVRTRAVQSRGVILTLITVALYWQTLVYASTKAVDGQWHPFLGMQVPNLLVGIAALFFYRRVLW